MKHSSRNRAPELLPPAHAQPRACRERERSDARHSRLPRLPRSSHLLPSSRETRTTLAMIDVASSAEYTDRNVRDGRVTTRDLADYLAPVNADVLFIDEDARQRGRREGHRRARVDGVVAAIGNAVFHAPRDSEARSRPAYHG
jgi:hypothetical protein